MTGTNLRRIETDYGHIEVETAICASCEKEVPYDETDRVVVGEAKTKTHRANYHTGEIHTTSEKPPFEGRLCSECTYGETFVGINATVAKYTLSYLIGKVIWNAPFVLLVATVLAIVALVLYEAVGLLL